MPGRGPGIGRNRLSSRRLVRAFYGHAALDSSVREGRSIRLDISADGDFFSRDRADKLRRNAATDPF
ncbi:MAG: hypothetical protein DCC65_11830 [Planctomycetota bacterium]|nr:MAG: hypothetical protein DCC65_11830 [Planctomycetota bacterium]